MLFCSRLHCADRSDAAAKQWHQGINPILADEMGLGKTLQCISLVAYQYFELQIEGPVLVVLPLSTMSAWLNEFAKWTPKLNVVSYMGNQESRDNIQKFELYDPRQGGGKNRKMRVHVVITTYEFVNRDSGFLGSIQWSQLIVDEAHRLKNHESVLYKALDSFSTDARLLVGGTSLSLQLPSA